MMTTTIQISATLSRLGAIGIATDLRLAAIDADRTSATKGDALRALADAIDAAERAARLADDIHTEISDNVAAFYAGAIDHATFTTRACAIWDRAHAAGVPDAVRALIRSPEVADAVSAIIRSPAEGQ